MSTLERCHALAAALWPDRTCRVTTAPSGLVGDSPAAQVREDDSDPSEGPLLGVTGATIDEAVEALAAELSVMARARAERLRGVAGVSPVEQPAARRGARLDDAALRDAIGVGARRGGVSTVGSVAIAGWACDAIREAERCADESAPSAVEAVERHVVMDGVADAEMRPSMLISSIVGDRITAALRLVPGRNVRVVMEVLP